MQILIVGAGPVGLGMAAELARYGRAVRLIERAAQATTTSKALVLWPRTLELFDRMGCTAAFLERGLRAHGASMHSAGRELGRAAFDEVDSPYPFALMLPQCDTERLLATHLATFGVRVERETELVGLVQADDRAIATLRHADGRDETVSTPWVLGCDGAHSATRHAIGGAFEGSTQADDWLLADVRVDGDGAPPADEVAIHLHRDGPVVIFPMPGGRSRVVAEVGRSDTRRPRPDPVLADVQALLERRSGVAMRVDDPVWLTHFRINERKVADYRKGRVFLAGDAAHIHSPAGGQGMNTGIQDAINLAWKLALVDAGIAAPGVLDSYSPERSAVGARVVRNATRLTDVATLRSPAAQAVRNAALRVLLGLHGVRRRLVAELSELPIGYRDSPLAHGPYAGERWAPAHYGGAPPGSGCEPRFVLHATDDEVAAALIARHPSLLERTPRAPLDRNRLHLVRPDGYVGYDGAARDVDAAAAWLARIAA